MEIDELLKEIEKCNKQILEINKRNDRERGRRDEIENNLKKQLNKYKEDYGVELHLDDMESIMTEYKKVYEERKEEVEKVGKILSLIQEGKFTEVNLMLGVSVESETPQEDEEKKKELIDMATNGMDSISLEVESESVEKVQDNEKSGFGALSSYIPDSRKDDTGVEKAVKKDEQIVEETKSEGKKTDMNNFSFEQLLNKKEESKPFEPRLEVEGEKEDDHKDFFSLPESSSGIFSSFGDLTKNTRFEPK